MPHIERDGVKVYYEDSGGEDLPVVLLSHGYSATSAMWAGQIEAGSDRFRIISWDMRGHGDTDSPDDVTHYSEEHTVDDMAAILDACGVERAVIGGLSLGGYMSLAFHLKYPERTAALMLFDTGPGYRNDKARDQWNVTAEQRAQRFEEQGLDAVGRGAEVRVSRHRSAQGLAHAARGMLAQRDARVISSLPEIGVATLVLVGEEDTPFLAATDYMADRIPGARKVVINDAGHAANIDQPGPFNEAFLEFLTEVA